ncbi:hypothetical protein B0H14DRAFT_2625376 [Mycena olivaceomarginata]|nr:hypothetical protein B0H14DRAFT_2625376 [Mycena olivaceomarginata]
MLRSRFPLNAVVVRSKEGHVTVTGDTHGFQLSRLAATAGISRGGDMDEKQLAQHELRPPTGGIVSSSHLTPVAPVSNPLLRSSYLSVQGVSEASFEIGWTPEVINIIYHYTLLSVRKPRLDAWSKDIVGHHLCLMYNQESLALAERIFRVDPDEEQLGFNLIVAPSGNELNSNVLEHWSTPTKGLIFATVKICYIENREEQTILQLDAVEMECRSKINCQKPDHLIPGFGPMMGAAGRAQGCSRTDSFTRSSFGLRPKQSPTNPKSYHPGGNTVT